jgi:NADH-quinone oxidoreductase subunit H
MISYELGLGLSALTVIMIAGTLNLRGIVEANIWSVSPWLWIPLLISFATYFVSSNAEINRTPFDMPEAEQEIVAGYLTEYSSIKWALFQMAEYVNMMTASAIIATLFLGGYKGPAFLDQWIPGISQWPIIWLILKMAIFMFTFIWMRATLPRLRYDQLMRLGWIYIFEIALASALICGAIIAFVL